MKNFVGLKEECTVQGNDACMGICTERCKCIVHAGEICENFTIIRLGNRSFKKEKQYLIPIRTIAPKKCLASRVILIDIHMPIGTIFVCAQTC